MIFHSPSAWFLLLLLLVPVIAWRLFKRRKSAAIMFSSTDVVGELRPSLKQRLRWILPVMTLSAIVLLILALARPQEGRKQTIIESEGIAIEMIVDRSGSMQAMDFQVEGQPVDRLTAVKDVASKFVAGDDKQLDGRISDLVGLISFAGQADDLSPPTLDHDYLLGQLDRAEIARQRSEDGTAIGDAIALAVEKLQALDDTKSHKVSSKVAILLTDGENNAGDVDPIQAAELAKTLGVKIYTIGVGTKGRAPIPAVDPLTGRTTMQWAEVSIDEDTLKKVAETTGGEYFRATDTESLAAIYQAIDQLEKSRVEEKHYVDHRELAIESVRAGAATVPPLLLIALLLLAAERILRHTYFRRVLD